MDTDADPGTRDKEPALTTSKKRLTWKDITEIIVGASMLVIPLAMTEEVWDLGRNLPLTNTIFIATVSYVFIGVFVYFGVYNADLSEHGGEFVKRVLAIYIITLAVSVLYLAAIDKFPLMTEPLVAIKRAVVVSLPGSFLATFVDKIS